MGIMSKAPKFTIVLSGYQTAPYLPKALDSILGQTFSDFEAICYVEESTDNSLAICQSYANRDSRFKVVSAPKSGAVATTRNYAISHATGEYLVVIDGDDWLRQDMLEKLDAKLKHTGEVDVVSFAAITTKSDEVNWLESNRLTNFRPADGESVFTGLEAIRRAGRNGGQMRNYTWLSIYRSAFLMENKLYQSDGRLMEDFGWSPRVWFFAKRFAYLDETLYAYRRRPGSLSTENSPRVAGDVARQFRSLTDFAANSSAPADIMRIWANQWLSLLYWFLFHPVTSRKIPNHARSCALAVLFEGNGKAHFASLAALANAPKHIASHLVTLAASGWQYPAQLFFKKIYYPLVEHRARWLRQS